MGIVWWRAGDVVGSDGVEQIVRTGQTGRVQRPAEGRAAARDGARVEGRKRVAAGVSAG